MVGMAGIKTVMRRARDFRRRIFHFNFYRCHLAFYIATILISSAIMYGSTAPPSASPGPNSSGFNTFRIYYPDALFMCTSAMTNTGLTSINMSLMTGYQQSILFVLMWLGDLSTISISVVFVRRWFFQKRMSELARKSRTAQKILDDVDSEKAERRNSRRTGNIPTSEVTALSRASQNQSRQTSAGSKQDRCQSSREANVQAQIRIFASHERKYGGVNAPWEMTFWNSISNRWLGSFRNNASHDYLSFEPNLDERGRFRRLKSKQYAELGGAEYRALQLLSWILPIYAAFWIFLTMVIITPYVSQNGPVAETIRTAQPGDTRPAWFGVFISLSAYTNAGLTLVNASMIPFQGNFLLLIVTGAAIVAGNTFYPIFLRLFIWSLYKLVPKDSTTHHALSFLLHHPRRCYLFLFDRKTTWILTGVQLGVILGEWVLFEILNINQTAVWGLSSNIRVFDGLYQSLSTRSSGFYIVTISSIAPAMQIIYIVTMYMSAFPLIISLRKTNVYEESSVGLDVDEYQPEPSSSRSRTSQKGTRFTAQHIRNQLAYDLWWIILSWFLVSIIEEPSLNDNAPGWNPFSVLFEVVSGYGNCGLSLGVPYDNYSLTGTFHTLSKLVMISVMLRGRHRILPMAIDRSILLPGQGLMEEMDRALNPSIKDEEALLQKIRTAEAGAQSEGRSGQQDPEPEAEREDAIRHEEERCRRAS